MGRVSVLSHKFLKLKQAGGRVDQPDLIDVLSSEQTCLGANVSLAQAERNVHTAVYSLLAATGSLELSEIGDSAQR